MVDYALVSRPLEEKIISYHVKLKSKWKFRENPLSDHAAKRYYDWVCEQIRPPALMGEDGKLSKLNT